MDPLTQYLRPSSRTLVSAEVWRPHLAVGYQDMHCRTYQPPDCCCCNWTKIFVGSKYNLRDWVHVVTLPVDYESKVHAAAAAAAAVELGTQSGGYYQSSQSTEKRTVLRMDQATCLKS